jgi:hypothetical protein
MSEYGRIWQEASDLRGALRVEIQKELLRPLPHNYKPADVRKKSETLERLVKQWEAIDEEMRQTDD